MESPEIQDISSDDYIRNIKVEFFNKYGYNIHVIVKEDDSKRLSLEMLERQCLNALREFHSLDIESLNLDTRKREIVMFRQIFFYLAVTKYSYGKTETGRYLVKDHATVIHSIKVCENYMFTKHKEFLNAFNTINLFIDEYVGNISKNNTGENNSKPDALALQYEREDASSNVGS